MRIDRPARVLWVVARGWIGTVIPIPMPGIFLRNKGRIQSPVASSQTSVARFQMPDGGLAAPFLATNCTN